MIETAEEKPAPESPSAKISTGSAVKANQKKRDELARMVEEFLDSGRQVEIIDTAVSKQTVSLTDRQKQIAKGC